MFVPDEPIRDTPEEMLAFFETMSQVTDTRKTGRTVKHNHPAGTITSWIINEWIYKSRTLPCNARGLFTLDNRIIVRGYDKFFNVDEVEATKPANIRKKSGPYEVTLKENGCIILVSGLEDGTLLVCSKHSIGPRPKDVSRNHAVEGENQLKKQLQRIGKSESELGHLLYSLNATAVAELCDDEFEEHVLEYTKDRSGLYLHGLNLNTIKFKSYSMDKVDAFAREWGFRPLKYFVKDDFDSLWEYLTKAAETGTCDGQEVEGFVVRTRNANEDFFFKYKFEEPYLLYRQFRETARALMNGTPIADIVAKQKKHNYVIGQYLDFTKELFEKNPAIMDAFNNNQGIVKVRKMFMEKFGLSTNNGMALLKYDNLDSQMKQLSLGETEFKYVLIPISTVGCGKTTTFATLTSLFPEWGHVQNDNISNSSKLKLHNRTLATLRHYQVVFCDRNNHQYRERAQIFKALDSNRSEYLPENVILKYIAVNFVDPNMSDEELWEITHQRVALRGDNHQSIKYSTDRALAESVMQGFVQRFQPLNLNRPPDSQFDHVIQLTLGKNSSLANAKKILASLREFTNLEIRDVTDAEFERAFETALGYTPEFTKTFKNKEASSLKKEKPLSYYGVRVASPKALGAVVDSCGSEMWEQLKSSKRVQDEFHVTLAHIGSTGSEEGQKVWKGVSETFGSPQPKRKKQHQVSVNFYCDLQLKRLVTWNKHLVCIEVDILQIVDEKFEKVEVLFLKPSYHITLGTAAPEIKPVLSNRVMDELHKYPELAVLDGETVTTYPLDGVLEKQSCFCFY